MVNKFLLRKDIQEYIRKNRNKDLPALVLRGSPFKEVSVQELAIQIKGHLVAEKKFPEFFDQPGILYPPKLNLEQTSSEITARYKASLVDGQRCIDLTGGLGIDSYYLSKKFNELFYCELNKDLAELASHNFAVLGAKNIRLSANDGLKILLEANTDFSWIYADPARRDLFGSKVFKFEDCDPDIPANLDLLFRKSENIMIKSSPILDLQQGINELKDIKEIHIVALRNEVKEVIWILKRGWGNIPLIKTINFEKKEIEKFDASFGERRPIDFSEPLEYLYEPNAAIMKSGLFSKLAEDTGTFKLHEHSHLYTSRDKLKFPGRIFKILDIMEYRSSNLKKNFKSKKANITTRNFPESVQEIRKKLKIKEGGDTYLFFTTGLEEKKIVISCKKVISS